MSPASQIGLLCRWIVQDQKTRGLESGVPIDFITIEYSHYCYLLAGENRVVILINSEVAVLVSICQSLGDALKFTD